MKVIKIGAIWCPGCIIMKPLWQEIEKELGWLETEYLDADNDKDRLIELGITDGNLPIFLFFNKQGEEFLRLEGEYPKDKLIKICQENKEK